MSHTNCIHNGEIIFPVDGALFSYKTVLKCTYWFGDKFHINIQREGAQDFIITLRPLSNAAIADGDLPYYQQKLERDLVDFHLREIVNNETSTVRALLVAKAFSNGEYDEVPPGEISDPVGFTPLN